MIDNEIMDTECLSKGKYCTASKRFTLPKNIAPALWLALNPIQAFHIVVSFVKTGDEFFIPSVTDLFLALNLLVKKV